MMLLVIQILTALQKQDSYLWTYETICNFLSASSRLLHMTPLVLQNTLGYDIRPLNVYLPSEISAEPDLLFDASSTVDL